MLNLGIVGAENSHAGNVAMLCNLKKTIPMRVPYIWGETPAFAKIAAEKGNIPNIVDDWRSMLGKVDGIMIDHRHPADHYEPAKFFIEHKVPVFVDKPFTHQLRRGKALLDLAEKNKVPVVTFSVVTQEEGFKQLVKEVQKNGGAKALNSSGKADVKSKYGGIFFYGIHQANAIVSIMGPDARQCIAHKNGPNVIANIFYKDGGIVTMNCLKEDTGGFHWRACTPKGVLTHQGGRGPARHRMTVKVLYKFFITGKSPLSRREMLAPIAILEALQKSLDTGRMVNVPKC